MNLQGDLLPLGIGSMPFKDVKFCCETAFKYYENFPYWPQLPNLNNYENMYIQYAENLPGVVADIEKGSIYVDIDKVTDEDKEKFYSNVLEENLQYFEISNKFSTGIYTFKELIQNIDKGSYEILKGHVTGPVSFGLTLTDKNKKSLIYNDEFRDIVTELIAMKGRWQEYFIGENMIIFFDEPYMVSYGSAFFNMPEDIIVDMFNRCFDKIKGLSGIHCCGNTDWSLVLKTNVNIINFDAFLYMDNFLLYAEDIKKFIENKGFLAWGLIPTNEKIIEVTIKDLENIFNKAIKSLTKAGADRELIFKQSFITPSCGTGSMKEEDALKVFQMNKEFSEYLRDKYVN